MYAGACVCTHVLVRILLLELAGTGGILIIQRNNKNIGKHLFGIGNISASCSNVFLSNKVYEVNESIEKQKSYINILTVCIQCLLTFSNGQLTSSNGQLPSSNGQLPSSNGH